MHFLLRLQHSLAFYTLPLPVHSFQTNIYTPLQLEIIELSETDEVILQQLAIIYRNKSFFLYTACKIQKN